jgi:ribosomal protein L37AE/L43A
MIRIRISVLAFVYLLLLLGTIFGVWLAYGLRKKKREKAHMRSRVHCSLCSFDFLDESTTELPRCPRCGSLNERLEFSTL